MRIALLVSGFSRKNATIDEMQNTIDKLRQELTKLQQPAFDTSPAQQVYSNLIHLDSSPAQQLFKPRLSWRGETCQWHTNSKLRSIFPNPSSNPLSDAPNRKHYHDVISGLQVSLNISETVVGL
jgi:hypothetical protein